MFTTTTTRFATSISAVAHRTKQNGRRSLVVTNVTKVNERSSFQFFSVERYFFSHIFNEYREARKCSSVLLLLLLLNTLRSFPRDYSPFLRVLLTSFSSSTNTTFDKISQIKSGCWMPRIAKNHERATTGWTACRPPLATVQSKPST